MAVLISLLSSFLLHGFLCSSKVNGVSSTIPAFVMPMDPESHHRLLGRWTEFATLCNDCQIPIVQCQPEALKRSWSRRKDGILDASDLMCAPYRFHAQEKKQCAEDCQHTSSTIELQFEVLFGHSVLRHSREKTWTFRTMPTKSSVVSQCPHGSILPNLVCCYDELGSPLELLALSYFNPHYNLQYLKVY